MELIHPDTRRSIEVREDQVALYVAQGWKPIEASLLVGEPGPEFLMPDLDA